MKRVITSSMESPVTLNAIYEARDSGRIKVAVVDGESLLDALKKLVARLKIALWPEMIEMYGWGPEKIIEYIEKNNDGAGSDYIIQLNNVSTRETLIQIGYFTEEEQ